MSARGALPPHWPRRLLLAGCGNMGGAMLRGWLAAGTDPAAVTILDPALRSAPQGCTLVRTADVLAGQSFDVVLLAMKPQSLREVAPAIAPLADEDTAVLSVLAGVPIAALAQHFAQAEGVVRVMPNLAAAIGRSPLALAASTFDDRRRDQITAFLNPLGQPEWIDEAAFDAVTALVGSGPAFVYRFIDALARGACALGLERERADRLALAMVEGAAMLAARAEDAPGALADQVASKGGTTRAGLDVLDRDAALDQLVHATLAAAALRSAEMSARIA